MSASNIVKRCLATGWNRLQSTFVQNVASTFATSLVSLTLRIANAAIIARTLGPEGKGVVALAELLPSMLALFLSGSIGAANVYLAGSRRASVRSLTETSIAFAIPVTVVGLAMAALFVVTGWLTSLLPGVPLHVVLVALLGFPLGLLNHALSGILQGLERIRLLNQLDLLQSTTLLVFTITLVAVFPLGISGAVTAYVISSFLRVIALSIVVRREGGRFLPRWRGETMGTVLSYGLRGHVGSLLQFFNYRLDMFLVNYYLDPAGVGIYSVSARLAELLWNLPQAVGYVVFPRSAASDSQKMNRVTPRIFRVTLALTAVGGLGLALTGRFLIGLVYSSEFIAAYVPLLVLLPGVVLLGGAKVLTNAIAGRGYPHYNSITSGVALVLTIALNLLFIPRYGVLGASMASSAAYILIFLMTLVFYFIVSKKPAYGV
jgi:O-antigen/teichoic acid export membrane protein